MATAGLGVPVKLLHESLGHVITVEIKTGQLYRGKLAEGVPRFSSLMIRQGTDSNAVQRRTI